MKTCSTRRILHKFTISLTLVAFLFDSARSQQSSVVVGQYNDLAPNVRVELLHNQFVKALLTCTVTKDVPWFSHKLDFSKCNGSRDNLEPCEVLASRTTIFGSRDKYKLSFNFTSPPRVQLEIFDVQPSDEGMYKCDLINEDTNIHPKDRHVGGAVFNLIVRQKLVEVGFVNTSTVQIHGDKMRIEYGKASSLICEALGGYPPPRVEVYIDGKEITDSMQRVQEMTARGSVTRLIQEGFKIDDRNWEHQHVKCRAFIDDPMFDRFGMSDTKRIQLTYAPHFESCVTIDNRVVGRPSTLVCTISANPPIQHAVWEIHHLNVTVRGNESTPTGLNAKVEERVLIADSRQTIRYEVRLDIANVTVNHKGNYTLKVGNRIGNNIFTYHYKPESKLHAVDSLASQRSNQACSMQGRQNIVGLISLVTLCFRISRSIF